MRTWSRADRDTLCGGCGMQLAPGDPVLTITVGVLAFLRCRGCEGPVPTDLPPLPPRQPITPTPLLRMRLTPNMLPLDFKARAAGREPGEEG